MKKTIIDVLENGIWAVGEHSGKIKRDAIEKLTKAVEAIDDESEMCQVCAGEGRVIIRNMKRWPASWVKGLKKKAELFHELESRMNKTTNPNFNMRSLDTCTMLAIKELCKIIEERKDANNETVCRHWAYCKVRQDFGCQRIEP